MTIAARLRVIAIATLTAPKHRYRPRHFHALERPHEGRQDKTQEDGECDRDEDFTREIERGDDKCADQ